MDIEFGNQIGIDHGFFISECAKHPGCIGCPMYQHGGTATIQKEDGTDVGTLICNTGVEKIEREKDNENETVQ